MVDKARGRGSAAKTKLPSHGANPSTECPVVFVHSSFRTGSTWLWSQFRSESGFYTYYEIFNEYLATLSLQTLNHSYDKWNSHHSPAAPYFIEFAPLIAEGGGVRGYQPAMALLNFFPAADHNGDHALTHAERAYTTSLIDVARREDRVPVLTCTRSLARIGVLKKAHGGLHVALVRSLLAQWFSYSDQFASGNAYFLGSVLDTVFSTSADPVASVLQRFAGSVELAGGTGLKPDDDALICFLVLHIYLEHLARLDADLVVNLDALAGDIEERKTLEAVVSTYSGLPFSAANAKSMIAAPDLLVNDIGRVEHMVISLLHLAINDGAGMSAPEALLSLGRILIAEFVERYRVYLSQAGALHARWRQDRDNFAAELEEKVPEGQRALELPPANCKELHTQCLAAQAQLATVEEALAASCRDAASMKGDLAAADELCCRLRASLERVEAERQELELTVSLYQERLASLRRPGELLPFPSTAADDFAIRWDKMMNELK